MKIKLYNKIAQCGLDRLPADFEVGADLSEENGIVVRSADLHEVEFPASLAAIARAGAGVNNIPVEKCAAEGIVVFNTPGANANAVKELCLTALLMSCRKVADGVEWAKTLSGKADALKVVEKEKSRFAGPEIAGKTLGVIGLGAIGGMVANAAIALGMNVLGYDPFASVAAAWQLDPMVKKIDELDALFAEADFISVHVPSLPTTRGIIGKENIAKMRDGVRIINLARADLAVDADVLEGLSSGKIAAYFTDFPTGELAGKSGVIATPHLGASTPEAEDNCAMMACDQIADYLKNGNIKNSVNMPAVKLGRSYENRVGVILKAGTDIENLISGGNVARGTRGDYTYLLAERSEAFDLDAIRTVGGVIRATAY